MIKRHTKKNQANQQGAIITREGTVDISNLMLAEKYDARASARSARTGGEPNAAAEEPAAPSSQEAKA
jgi:ribosomal protein L24